MECMMDAGHGSSRCVFFAVFLFASNYLRKSEAKRGCLSVKASFSESWSQTRLSIVG